MKTLHNGSYFPAAKAKCWIYFQIRMSPSISRHRSLIKVDKYYRAVFIDIQSIMKSEDDYLPEPTHWEAGETKDVLLRLCQHFLSSRNFYDAPTPLSFRQVFGWRGVDSCSCPGWRIMMDFDFFRPHQFDPHPNPLSSLSELFNECSGKQQPCWIFNFLLLALTFQF